MDRKIIYPGQIPLETDLLGTNQSTMVALSKLASALFGSSITAIGLAVGPTSPATLSVQVAPGEIYSLQPLEATAYSSLPADTTHSIVKQGILLDATTLACPAPTTAGFSINYLIEATYQEIDDSATVLPFYNASNPSQAYSGPNNSGASSATRRAGKVVLQAKAGIAATTGTQTTPSTDVGFVAIAVVTVANGQSTIVAGNIVAVPGSQVLSNSLLTQIYASRQQAFTGSGVFTVPNGVTTILVSGCGGGGGGGGGGSNNTSGAAGSCGAGGGAGKSIIRQAFAVTPGTTITIIIGSAGTGGNGGAQVSDNAQDGGAGGATTIGSLITLAGGSGGGHGRQGASSGAVPGPIGGSGFPAGGYAADGQNTGATNGYPGLGGMGASSPFGGGGGAARASSSATGILGAAAYGFGGGGGGGGSIYGTLGAGGAGGSGTPGYVFIEW